jgi:hypothetical protein
MVTAASTVEMSAIFTAPLRIRPLS